MKRTFSREQSAIRSFRLLAALALASIVALPSTLFAPPPAWWTERGAIDPSKPTDDYAAANLGQLKHFASKAALELALLPGGSAAIPEVNAMIASWSAPAPAGVVRDDYAAVNLGQLKAVAKPFYDRLIAVGYTTTYPWTLATSDDDNYAVANLGQLKHVFSFDVGTDSDGDALPDWWEELHGTDPIITDTDFDGFADGIDEQPTQAGFYTDIAHMVSNPTNANDPVPTAIDISWNEYDLPTGVLTMELQRAPGRNAAWQSLAASASTQLVASDGAYTDTELLAGLEYRYRLLFHFPDGKTETSEIVYYRVPLIRAIEFQQSAARSLFSDWTFLQRDRLGGFQQKYLTCEMNSWEERHVTWPPGTPERRTFRADHHYVRSFDPYAGMVSGNDYYEDTVWNQHGHSVTGKNEESMINIEPMLTEIGSSPGWVYIYRDSSGVSDPWTQFSHTYTHLGTHTHDYSLGVPTQPAEGLFWFHPKYEGFYGSGSCEGVLSWSAAVRVTTTENATVSPLGVWTNHVTEVYAHDPSQNTVEDIARPVSTTGRGGADWSLDPVNAFRAIVIADWGKNNRYYHEDAELSPDRVELHRDLDPYDPNSRWPYDYTEQLSNPISTEQCLRVLAQRLPPHPEVWGEQHLALDGYFGFGGGWTSSVRFSSSAEVDQAYEIDIAFAHAWQPEEIDGNLMQTRYAIVTNPIAPNPDYDPIVHLRETFTPDDDLDTDEDERAEKVSTYRMLDARHWSGGSGERASPLASKTLIPTDPEAVIPRGKVSIALGELPPLPIEAVSRDRFLAGSFEIPFGWDGIQMSFINLTSGENLGSYGSLLGGGTTKIYNAVTDIMNEADVAAGGQSDNQKVWFVKDPMSSRKVHFYTCFNDIGEVQIKLSRSGDDLGGITHQLVAAGDFADWITYVDSWVKGSGFEFLDGNTPPGIAANPPTGPPDVKAPFAASTASGEISNLTRACLIPLFTVVAQVEGMEAVALGMFEGVKMGLKDDWEMVSLVGSGTVLAGNWAVAQVATELVKWREPSKRARELKRMTDSICEEMIFKPFQHLSAELSTWDGFRKRAWSTWDRIKNAGSKAWTITQSSAGKVGDGLLSWCDDFNDRMLDGAEKVAFRNTPWAKDRLLGDLAGFGRQWAFTSGYVFGYICEQVAVGAVTAGTTKIAQVVVKGGIAFGGQLAKRTAFVLTAQAHLLKQSLKKRIASQMVSLELHLAIQRGFTTAAKTRVSDTIRNSAGEVMEAAFSRHGFDRGVCNLNHYVEAAVINTRTKDWALRQGSEWQFLVRTAQFVGPLQDRFTAKAARGWLKVMENSLPLKAGDLDRGAEWASAFKLDTLAGRMCLTETLEAAESKTIKELLEKGIKVSDKIKDVYPTMYSYLEESTLISHADALGNGIWRLREKQAGRYIGTHNCTLQSEAKDLFPLPLKEAPPGVFSEDPTKGRFKIVFNTSQVATDISVPRSYTHSGVPDAGVKDWLEIYAKDNPTRGGGGGLQFTSPNPVTGQLFDLKTGLIVRDRAHLDELMQQ